MPGLQARRTASAVLRRVVDGRVPFDALVDEANGHREFRNLSGRDRALVRTIVDTALRHRGEIDSAIRSRLDKPLDRQTGGAIAAILHAGAAQILYMDVPDHAAVNLAVTATEADRRIRNARGLVNSLLRRVARERDEILARQGAARLNVPDWMFARWADVYGEERALRIVAAHEQRPALDLTARSDPEAVAAMTGGTVLPTGTVRLENAGRVSALPGYDQGAWWVQDAAAALPARLIGGRTGLRVADLCAAPGGKSAQLAATGCSVTALDLSANRLKRLVANFSRLGLNVETVCADILDWQPDEPYDAVLLDAPCTATGTIRRHPDIAWLKTEADIATLSELQQRLLDRAAGWVKPGGRLVYCTCSLEPEEGEHRAEAFLRTHSDYGADPLRADEIGGLAQAIDRNGWLRTLPFMAFGDDTQVDGPLAGMDGFFAARFRRVG